MKAEDIKMMRFNLALGGLIVVAAICPIFGLIAPLVVEWLTEHVGLHAAQALHLYGTIFIALQSVAVLIDVLFPFQDERPRLLSRRQ